MVVREAFAFGTPVAVSAIGPLPSIVQNGKNGVLFSPGNSASLLAAVRDIWERPHDLERLGLAARASFERRYTEDANYGILMEIYQQAIEVNRTKRTVK